MAWLEFCFTRGKMRMISNKDLAILSELRQNSRKTLTRMSRKTNIPISTLYEKIKGHEGGIIKKYTALLDFGKLGFNTTANLLLKVCRDDRESLKDYLIKCQNVNSVVKINNGYDFLVEVIFQQIVEVEGFLEKIESKFKIEGVQVYYIIEEIKREAFMEDPAFMTLR